MMQNLRKLKLLSLLPADVRDSAVDLSDCGVQVQEYALPLEKATIVLDAIIEAKGIPLGGDLWLRDPRDEDFDYGNAPWSVDAVEGESHQDRIARVRNRAGEFFSACAHNTNGYVSFVFRFGSRNDGNFASDALPLAGAALLTYPLRCHSYRSG